MGSIFGFRCTALQLPRGCSALLRCSFLRNSPLSPRQLAQLRQYTTEEMNERSANGITAGSTARCSLCVSVFLPFGATHHLALNSNRKCIKCPVRKLANASMHERTVFE